mmetsp:Transcript_36850/g.94218  ORF Transcript_36850/g.94218 Transcript_36850/m.94218 type:complete len:128 (+) Transcript_36850:179-562(+)|eukprot:jgi/Tetstr1/456530/TSEL_043252.t1
MAKLPKDLPRLLATLEDYSPTIPDELTAHCLEKSGHHTEDIKLIRLMSVATQSFIQSIVNDSLEVCKRRKLRMQQRRQREEGYNPKDKRLIMISEDLVDVLQEYGVNMKVPPYFAETKGAGAKGPVK